MMNEKLNEKYITFRKDRRLYQVKLRNGDKSLTKSCKTLEEAIAVRDRLLKLHELDKDILIKKDVSHESLTFNKAYLDYVEYKKPTIKPSTVQNYMTTFYNFTDYIGEMPLEDITNWETLCKAIIKKQKLKYNYFSKSVKRIKAMYDYYIKEGILKENPLTNVRLIDNDDKLNRRRAFTDKEKEKFLDTAKKYYKSYYLLFYMYFQTGCRRGELPALQWKDIDFENKVVHIYKTATRGIVGNEYKEIIATPKTKSSIRDIPISDRLIFQLQLLKKMRNADNEDYIFQGIERWISVDIISQKFRKIKEKAKLPKELKLHCIRHTFASNLITHNVDLATICSIGGWSSPTILLSVYAHSNSQKMQDVMKQFVFD